ncbi:MAG: hypothetical protein AB1689_05265 [Thermodesulfobacteriota bacterium]
MLVRGVARTVLLVLLLPAAASAAGKCDEGGVHAAQVAAAREAVRDRCPCQTADSHLEHLRCAWDVIQTLAASGELPRVCRGRVRQFATRSICGRPGMAVCCVATRRGPWRPVVRRLDQGCAEPRSGGAACKADFAHLGYACIPDAGCRPSTCGDGILDRNREWCEPPGTPICDSECRLLQACGNGVLDASAGEECEPPGSASCDAQCRFLHTCGDGIIEPGEECDGQDACGSGCTLARSVCCDVAGPGYAACLGTTAYGDFEAYWYGFKPCHIVAGRGSWGTCDGPPCPDIAPEAGCHVGACADQPIEPLALCCQQASGGCRDTVAATAGAVGGFGCGYFPPPDQGEVDRLMLGTCGADGRCVPAS